MLYAVLPSDSVDCLWPARLYLESGLNLVRRVQLSESRAADSRAAGVTVPTIAARVLLS